MKPRTPALDRRTAMRLAATEYQRCAELLRSLDSREWAAPTACPAWDVRQMAAHMLGMVEMAASIREGSRRPTRMFMRRRPRCGRSTVTGCEALRGGCGGGQEIAAFTSSATFFSTMGLHFLSAYDTGHKSPSSRFAASWKPRVE